jgi:DNA mismatch repair protein MutS
MSTPMLEQYETMKKEYPDTILLFRLGDFYEGFNEDAKTLSRVLGITLTGRGSEDNRMPMAGIPFHALNQYLPKLIRAGLKVAIAEQMEEPKAGQIVKREVTKIITAGTVVDENMLDESDNNYIVSIYLSEKGKYQVWGFSFADISTGEFKANEYRKIITESSSDLTIAKELLLEIHRIKPAEMLLSKRIAEYFKKLFPSIAVQVFDETEYYASELEKLLLTNLKAENFKGFGLENMSAGIVAAGKLYQYLLNNRKASLPQITKLSLLNHADYMLLDEATIRNLELIFPLRDNNYNKTLFGVLNKCQTPMGQRRLRQWILRPLLNLQQIENRQDCINEFFLNAELLDTVEKSLSQITDLERVLARIGSKSANARDLLFLKNGLNQSLNILQTLAKQPETSALRQFLPDTQLQKDIQENIVDLVEKAIKENPSLTISEGNIIKAGYDSELDLISQESQLGKDFIQSLEAKEIQRTGINSLKVRFNRVFGYYIEISKSNIDKVPSDYIRKQTLVNGERYITSELKEWEDKVLGAEEKINFLEYQIFEKVRMQVIAYIKNAQFVIEQISQIDCLANLARLAHANRYVKPILCEDLNKPTTIIAGRHPVVENALIEKFVPNDIMFRDTDQQIIILTGPNMSGKSTYIRQVALIILMAQIGSFVPADSAEISIADRIFTRVGASDNLAGGESTFMVEMNETANILNNATKRSLIILDEVGRGTSTYDGVAIAWSIVEQLAQNLGARSLFATHYHELIQLESIYECIKNFNIQVVEKNGKIYFMHKIIAGGTDKSYGIHVAELAGIPNEVITRAHNILEKLELNENNNKNKRKIGVNSPEQMNLMLKEPKNALLDEIKALDINTLTPIDALNILRDLQIKADKPNDH